MGKQIADLAAQTAEVFTGGDTLREVATGGDIQQGLTVDAAGLSAGSGIAGSGLLAGEAAAGGATGALMPAAIAEPGGAAAVEAGLPGTSGYVPASVWGITSAAQTLRNAATILTPVASLAASASGISAARRAGTIPKVAGPTILPSSGGPNTIMSSRAAVTEQLRRRGRASTIMTAPQAETLGG